MKRYPAHTLLNHFVRDERGTLVTEFAVTMPLMLILLFGLIGTGSLLWYHHIVTNGVRDGTRYLSRVADPTAEPHLTRAKNLAMSGITDSDGYFFHFWTNPDSIVVTQSSIANPGGAFRDSGAVPVVRMTATVSVSIPVLGFSLLGLNPSITYSVADEARWIGR